MLTPQPHQPDLLLICDSIPMASPCSCANSWLNVAAMIGEETHHMMENFCGPSPSEKDGLPISFKAGERMLFVSTNFIISAQVISLTNCSHLGSSNSAPTISVSCKRSVAGSVSFGWTQPPLI